MVPPCGPGTGLDSTWVATSVPSGRTRYGPRSPYGTCPAYSNRDGRAWALMHPRRASLIYRGRGLAATSVTTTSSRRGGLAGSRLTSATRSGPKTAIGFPGCTITCNAFLGTPLSEPAAGGDVTSVGIRWDASVRARLGYLATPEVLVFATGGLAWQNIRATGLCGDWHTSNYCFGPGPGFGQPVPSFVTQSTTRTGWTVGGGVEWRIFGNWLVRGEYRYANFGTWNSAFPFGPSVNPFTGESGDDNTTGLGSARKLTSRSSASLTSSIEGGAPAAPHDLPMEEPAMLTGKHVRLLVMTPLSRIWCRRPVAQGP
jgi:opacity protein-like surface antigen